jgi:hypothetical protein
MPDQPGGASLATLIERFVLGEGRPAYGFGRPVADQNEARSHRTLLQAWSLEAYS